MKRIPKKVLVSGNKWIPVKLRDVENGKLGYWDSEKEEIVISKHLSEMGKFIILINEIIHVLDGQNVANKLYKKSLTENQMTYLAAGLFATLSLSKMLDGFSKKQVMDFYFDQSDL